MTTVMLEEERARPDGRVERRVVNVGDLSWLGKTFTGQGRAVTLTKVEASGDIVTWRDFHHFYDKD